MNKQRIRQLIEEYRARLGPARKFLSRPEEVSKTKRRLLKKNFLRKRNGLHPYEELN